MEVTQEKTMNKNFKVKDILTTKYALPIVAGLGLAITMAIVKLQPSMEHKVKVKKPVVVNTIILAKHALKPTITGFGSVEPDLTLQSKAEVSGRIVYLHPELKKGAMLLKDTTLIKIDDKDYQLSLKQAEADLLSNEANLREMKLTVDNTKLDLKLAQEKLNVREKEFSRLIKLRKSGVVSQSKLDAEKQNLLAQKQEVQQTENTQTTLPAKIEVLKANIAISKAKVEQSLRDIARTEIKLPFNARIRSANTQLNQYVTTGTILFDAAGMDKVLINAQFPADQFKKISASFDKKKLNFEALSGNSRMSDLFQSFGLTAQVSIAGIEMGSWQAKVERISDDIDPQSRTIGIIVSVSDSYKTIEPGAKPPLLEGNYMRVELSGSIQNFIVLPRAAIHKNQAYRVDKNNSLQRVDLNNVQMQGELALIVANSQNDSILYEGEQIVTSDVFPAVNGMTLEVVHDKSMQTLIKQWVEKAQ